MALSVPTLMMAIRSVDAEATRLERKLRTGLHDTGPSDSEYLLALTKAATEMRTLYEEERRKDPSLSPYDDLVQPRRP